MKELNIIAPRSATSFILKKGQRLKVVDIEGEQVSDLVCYNLNDKAEYLSSGRTIDYAETIFLTKGHPLYSNRSNVMLEIIEDTVGAYGNPWSAEIDDGPNSFGVRTMWTDKLPNLPTKAKKAKKKKEKVVPTPTKEIEPTKLTTEIAKKVVESVLFDGEVKKRMERRGGWLFSHVPGGVAGTLKNLSVFPVEVVEQIFPSVDFGAHQDDCNGLAELAYGKVKDDPDLADYKFDLASRLNSINADHEGLELRIKGKIYILDWHQTLEPENPLIFNAKDWFVADDSKGIPYKDFLQGAELP
jgi:hypothetical protein